MKKSKTVPSINNKLFSCNQENRIARELGWKVVSGSGSRPCNVGDIQCSNWIGECKTHIKFVDKIVFYKSVWNKIKEEASSKFKYPCLFVDDGTQNPHRTLVMFSKSGVYSDLLSIINLNKKYTNSISITYIEFKKLLNSIDGLYKAVTGFDDTSLITDLYTFKELIECEI